MLEYTMESEDILRVDEKIYGWNNTEHRIIRYNIKTWESQLSYVDKKKWVTDRWEKMNQSSIDWVKKYYLPKVGK